MLRDADKKMVERPDNEPKFDKKNKTDRKMMMIFLILGGIMLVLAVFLVTYYFVFMH